VALASFSQSAAVTKQCSLVVHLKGLMLVLASCEQVHVVLSSHYLCIADTVVIPRTASRVFRHFCRNGIRRGCL